MTMTKTLVRSKSLRFKKRREQAQEENEISSPCLVATDAEPRYDLYDLKRAALSMHPVSQSNTSGCDQRPKTAGGDSERPKGLRRAGTTVDGLSKTTAFEHPPPYPGTIICSAKVQGRTIGMALGNPPKVSPWDRDNIPNWLPPNGSTCTLVTSISSGHDTVAAQHDDQKPKVSRWKSIFGRRPSRAPQQSSSCKAQTAKQRERAATTPAASKPATLALKTHLSSNDKSEDSPTPRIEVAPPTSPDVPKATVSTQSKPVSDKERPAGLMLDIEIPNIAMERYSVMFGTVLQPAHPPSLLVRRQGNTDKLKPLNELKRKPVNELLRPQRRATSPALTRSPSFSLFPAVDTQASNTCRPQPLQRSQTAPGALSPSRAVFENPDDQAVEAEILHSLGANPEILPPTPTTAGTTETFGDYCLTPVSIVGSLNHLSKPEESEASPYSPHTPQISIARKISVSRPSTDMLKPIVASGRVVTRKPRTPTLVEPLRRVSQRVEVEGA